MRRFATYVLAAGAAFAAGAAAAQSVPEGQSCGGILCDMGVFGHKIDPAPPPAAAPPVKTSDLAPLAPEPAAPKKRRVAPRVKRVAKAVPIAPRPATPASVPVKAAPVVAAAPVAAPKAAAPPAPAAKPVVPPTPTKAAASPPPEQPNPNLMFQPIY